MTGRMLDAHADERQQAVPHTEAQAFGRLLPFVTLAALLPLLLHGIAIGELFFNTDEPVHAVGGLFFADVFRDLPLAAPVQYAYKWYAQYPALGLIHWPPIFYMVEGAFFLAFGSTAVVARLSVVAFALFGLFYWFRLVQLLSDTRSAICATVLLACTPALLLFQRSVMLEMPALSLCLAATFYWLRYTRAPKATPGDVYRFALFAALALLTKQHSAYLAVFCLLSLLAEKRLALLFAPATLRALVLIILLAGPFYALALYLHGRTVVADLFQGTVEANTLTFYLEALPRQLGLPLLFLGIIGVLTSRWWTGARVRPVLVWIVACYVTFTVVGQKDARYAIYWLPAFVFFAVGALTQFRWPAPARAVANVMLLALLGYQVWTSVTYERPYIAGYEAAVRHVMRHGNPGFVLFDGELHGNFIFYFRVQDTERRGVVLRKALYVTRVLQEYGSRELLRDRADIGRMLAQYGVRYVVVDNSAPRFNSQTVLRQVLNDPPFVLAGVYPVESNVARYRQRTLFVYEHPSPPAPTVTDLRLPMLTLPSDINVPVSELGLGTR